ncbi:hypothetical protein JOQ06_001355, partial [Pogonophryne albipinna]
RLCILPGCSYQHHRSLCSNHSNRSEPTGGRLLYRRHGNCPRKAGGERRRKKHNNLHLPLEGGSSSDE